MTIEQLITLLQNSIPHILAYEETDIYEIFESKTPEWRYGIEKEFLHSISPTSFKAMELIKNISDFFRQ